ncbi:lipoyl domain-containing protein [Acidiplasma cupricumulans]|uniref:lipoyl domain-containing protein n=1 Tax=Acidiplasma cupricumulans TaxID=312540 RepID=UPI0015857723|nr:lipoyl domain-containing protein [Acidiplasma cupricumulans]
MTLIKMPSIWNFEELGKAVVTQWYVKEGDSVKEGDPVCQIMAAKVTVEVPSPVTGTVKKIMAEMNQKYPQGTH